MTTLFCILGDQLIDPALLPSQKGLAVYMAETADLCRRYRFHQLKLVFHLSAMRHYAAELRAAGYEVLYRQLPKDGRGAGWDADYATLLAERLACRKYTALKGFAIADRFMDAVLDDCAAAAGIKRKVLPTPVFLTGHTAFDDWYDDAGRLHMADFYRWQRRRLGILVEDDGAPIGGRWSFDGDNRERLPADHEADPPPRGRRDDIDREVEALVREHFADHPGGEALAEGGAGVWFPTGRGKARRWLQHFCQHNLADFGTYQDAFSERSELLHHSVLSPLLNVGLLTPREVLDAVLGAAQEHEVAINNLEGFVRQLIGWREFVRGVHHRIGREQARRNAFDHHRQLTGAWYTGDTGLPPLDAAIRKTMRLGYAHHIERLMVLGNYMNLCEIHPQAAHRWFMENFLDSAEWVMGPNVFGMALQSDGGLMTTKPYVCGSNYLVKMGAAGKGDWCDIADGLYWRFIGKHRATFADNQRMVMAVRTFERMGSERKERILAAADAFIDQVTTARRDAA